MIKINKHVVETNKFPDGTLLIKETPDYDIASISWLFENKEELVTLIYLTNHLRANGVKRIELYMPYIPNARQSAVDEANNFCGEDYTLEDYIKNYSEARFEVLEWRADCGYELDID